MSLTCHDCERNEDNRPLPEAGSAVNSVMLNGSSEALRHALNAHDLSIGVADCGCVVMDFCFCPCKEHSSQS